MLTQLKQNTKIFIQDLILKMSNFEAYYTRGLELYSKKKYQNAISYFQIALKKKDAQSKVYYNIALSFQQLNKVDNAIEYYQKFLEYYPTDYSGLYNLALLYYNKKDYENAASYFEKSLDIKKEETNVRALSKCYIHLEKIQKLMLFSEYIFDSDCNKICYYAIAQTLERKHYLISDFTYVNYALDMYLKLLDFSPECFNACLSASLCYSKKGDWVNAIFYCQRALTLNKNSYEANNQMGLVYYCSDDMPHSIEFYEKAFKINSKTDYKIYSNLAYAYEKNGEIETAIKLFKELVRKFSECPVKKELRDHVRQLIQSNTN